jgi:hypothetical protein
MSIFVIHEDYAGRAVVQNISDFRRFQPGID